MKYRLGLDIGTASVGLVALELDGKNLPVKPIWSSVRIFDEPLLPPKSGGVGESKKAARRLARQQRRLHERYSRRMERIAELARKLGIDPETIPADKGQHIHRLRAEAADSEISLKDLIRVFLKMGKRRGYYGGFKAKKDKDKGIVETGINELKEAMEKHDCETLGQYLWWRIQQNLHLRLKEDGLFADRQIVEDEFKRIWETQEKHHPALKNKYKGKSFQAHFHQAITEQRPLKSPAAMVGNCSLEPMLPRAPMAQPLMQAFRIEKQIADLRWGTTRNAKHLCAEQREVIREQLQNDKEVKFTVLYKALEKAGCPGPEGRELNLANGDRETLTGDRTARTMKSLGLLDKWRELAEGHQISVINLLADMGSPEAFDIPEWDKQLLGSKKKQRDIKAEVKNFIDEMLETGKFDHLGNMDFDRGRGSYSIKALRKLVEIMRENAVDEHNAIDEAYPDYRQAGHGREADLKQELLRHKPTGNTVVDVALRQVHREVNKAIKQLGTPPSEIVVELTRDMKTGLKTRAKITKKMRANEKRRKSAAKEIENHTQKAATPSQIKRYLLWEEQGKKYCSYCVQSISLSDAINGNKTEYGHILPKSLTRIGKKRDFLVLAHKKCNQDTEDKTPWQAWGKNKERWPTIEYRAKQFKDGYKVTIDGKEKTFKHEGKARQLLIRDFETETLDEGAIEDFTDRQFQESAWIAKACGKWLRDICTDVSVSRGLLTAHLRRIWKLDTVIPKVRYEEGMPVFDEDYNPRKLESNQENCKIEKEFFNKHRSYWEGHSHKDNRTHRRLNKRIDHRHHLVDALVIALTTRGLYQCMARDYKKGTDSGRKNLRLEPEPELQGIRKYALNLVRECRPSHRPDHWLGGNMFKENPSKIIEKDGKRVYAQRKKLSELTQKDIENIEPESLRVEIKKVVDKRIAKGDSLEQALQKDLFHPHWKTPIRKVRICGVTASDAVRVEHPYRDPKLQGQQKPLEKYLKPDGYAYLEFNNKDENSGPRPIPLHEALKPEATCSSLSDITRLYKGDTVRDSDEKYFVVRQIKAQGPSLILTPVTEAIADSGRVKSPRRRIVKGKRIKDLTLIKDERPSNSVG